MPTKIILAFLLAALAGRSADGVGQRPGSAVITLEGKRDSDAVKFTDAQRAYVGSWIREKAPEAPPEIIAPVAQRFLEDLQLRRPDQLDRLLTPGFSLREFEPTMLRLLGAQLVGPSQATVREAVARRRIDALSLTEGRAASGAPALMAKIRDQSYVAYQRLLEGRMDDDELLVWLGKVRQGGTAGAIAAPVKARVLTAADIVGEFSRRNQQGSALQKLRAYTIEGRLRTATGEEQHLFVFRLRPDRFRLVVQQGTSTRYILAGNGTRFWQQVPGRPAQSLTASDLGDRRFLGEFIDPLLAPEGYGFERLADGVMGGRACYRIVVRRSESSSYIACIDTETFRALGRENPDKSAVRYSDFREVAGVTMAFSEEVTDHDGRKATLLLNRVTPNPGLVQAMFDPPSGDDAAYFHAEPLLAQAPAAPGKSLP